MSKKSIIITLIVTAVLIIIAIVIQAVVADAANHRNITFTIEEPAKEIAIYKKGDETSSETSPKVGTVSHNQTIRLRLGDYYYMALGDGVDTAPVDFTIEGEEKDQTIKVFSSFTADHLEELLKDQMTAIETAVNEAYPSVMPGYVVNNAQLLNKGDYAGILLTPVDMDENNPMGYYRALLVKTGDDWKVIGRPEIVLTKYTTPDVDVSILRQVNDISLR